MEAKKAYKSFRYKTDLVWKPARRGTISSLGKPNVEVGSSPDFRGEPGIWTPEDLFVGSLNTCLMLTFLALAQSKGISVVSYESSAEGLLENVEGKYHITEVTVTPSVALKSTSDLEGAKEIMPKVKPNCFISNSVRSKITYSPQFRVEAGG